MKKIILLFCILSWYHLVKGQSGTPDPSFGNNGYISTYATETASIGSTSSMACFILPDGKFILVLLENKTILTRRLSNGDIDASYGNNGYSVATTMIPKAAAMQADGKIVVAGNTDGTTDFMLARYNTDGTLDASFGNGGVIITDIGSPTDFLKAVVVTTAGKIIAGGTIILNGHEQFVLAQYTSSGIIDNMFGNNGFVRTDFNNSSSSLSSLALQPDGRIVATGVTFVNNQSDLALARYHADGTLDMSFNLTGKTTSDFSTNDWGSSVVINDDGNIYVGGSSLDASGHRRFTVARYNADGLPDLNFNAGSGFVAAVYGASTDNLINIRIQSDGKIVAAGHTSSNDEDFDVALIRINTNGTIDNNFGTNGNGRIVSDLNDAQDESGYLLIQPDDKIFTGGSSSVYTATVSTRFACFRYNVDGTPDSGFGNGGVYTGFFSSANYNYWAVFQQNDGKILSVSESYSATVKQFISRFNSNGTPDNTYGQNGTYELNYVSGLPFFQPDGKIVRLSHSPTNNGDIMLVRNNPDGTPDAGFGNDGTVITDFGGNESGAVVAFGADGKIVVGGLSRDNNGSDFLVVRYSANGTVDGSFGNGGSVKMNFKNEDQVQSIAIAADGKIVFGGMSLTFPPFFDRLKFYALVVRLNPDGSFDNNFGDQGKTVIDKTDHDNIGSVLVQNDSKVIFTRFQQSNSSGESVFIGRLNADGSIDNNFGQNGDLACDGHVMFQQIDQKILILGAMKNNRNNTDFTLTRLNPDGIVDMSFGTNGKTTISFTHLDNFFYTGFLSANSLFVGGGGIDEMGTKLGMIAKFRLELEPDPEFSISCPDNQIVNTDSNLCGANIYGIDPVTTPDGAAVKYELTGATTGSGNGSVSGLLFNTGITSVTYTLTDDATKSCSFNVTVQDDQVPAINDLGVSQTSLWPPHHKLRDITVNYSVSDNCSVANTQVSISSNEPVQSSEKDDESPDWEILDNHHIRLRAERLETGNGRIYTIKITATDVNGNQDTATAIVNVPKSMGRPAGEDLLVTVSPNPSPNYFFVTINSNSGDKIRVRLLDNRGTVLSTMTNVSVQQTLRIGDELKAGIYFLEVTQSGITKTTKILKQ